MFNSKEKLCKKAIEKAINENYSDYSLDVSNALKEVKSEFVNDTISAVL